MTIVGLEAGELALCQGDGEGALAACEQAAAAAPNSAAAQGGRGRALLALGRPEAAVGAFQQAAELEPQAVAWQNLLGVAQCQSGDLGAAEATFRQACEAAPQEVTALLNLVDLYRFQGRYTEALAVMRKALGLAPGNAEVLANFGLLSVDLEEIEGVRLAVRQLGALPLLRLQVPELTQPLLPFTEADSQPEQAARAVLHRAWAEQLQRLPAPAREQRLATALRRQAQPPRTWATDEVALFCRQHLEKWSPRSLQQGIGGSEEAVIYLSRELARLGWRVTVYGNPLDEAGYYEGVTYRSYYGFNPADRFNILVGWRGVGFFDAPYVAQGAYLWLHDVPRAARFTLKRLGHLDQLFVLSRFHREQLPAVPDKKFLVTRNGIDLAQFEALDQAGLVRQPSRCIYASAYDRGLETLLLIWPHVRQAVPLAELDIFYGWETFDALSQGNAESQAWKARLEGLMQQPGVNHHGRVGQPEVLAATYRSGVWAYPTHFPEISCITAMKCQAAGAIPVTSDFAALRETVQFGFKLEGVTETPYSPRQREAYGRALVEMLQNPARQEQIRQQMVPWARQTFSWHTVARQWDKVFRAAGGR